MRSFMFAELSALDSFDWIVEPGATDAEILEATHTAYLDEIEDNRAHHAGRLDPSRVTFVWGTDDSTLFAVTDLRTDRRREA